MTLNIEADIAARIAAMEDEPQASADPTQVRREILVIEDALHTTAAEAGTRLRSLSQIELTGIPSPSSHVTRGIIRFRPASDLKPPYYKDADKTIRIWLDIAHRDHVLYQLSHRKRYLWIGYWPGDYVYADLHSRP